MKIKETRINQNERLKIICELKEVDYSSMEALLESVKTKKLFKRNNYHQQKINDVIEKSIK
ncbi:DNA modification system-associated small protein [Flavobacterium rakeshii]|uniref:DNA modification system-associated small protein n=1 Tax=Flavobacterium rakeshii TaxID=1038845 RepID=UPI002E7AE6FD|nr:DNA modification system-associated small protein [Flavobacterium rakeshii]MEE1897448.1 DNA modification system-associated small protein [Flavobacterium rakeshii]